MSVSDDEMITQLTELKIDGKNHVLETDNSNANLWGNRLV